MNSTIPTYDLSGEISFIIVVLFWYSLGMVCMLGMQIKIRDETIEDCARRRAKLVIENLRDQTHTKQILEELVDKQKRNKLWQIYLDRTDHNDKLYQAESLRIRNIEKQLAIINRNFLCSSSSTVIPNLSTIEQRFRVRRRSSFDQQILERWKILVDQSKRSEQLPWTIQKLIIRRQFRRHYKTMLREPEDIDV